MPETLHSSDVTILREEIVSQCIWSDTYSSLKHILKRTANTLPLLISFLSTDDDSENESHFQTIFFFDRNLSKKLLFTPLQQSQDQSNSFEVYPQYCTFAITDSFKGLFEFVRNGQRRTKIFTTVQQMMTYASHFQWSTVFMSRDRATAYYHEADSTQWLTKEYPQGAIFRAERIHRSTVRLDNGEEIANDYLECHDEDGYCILIQVIQLGRYSIIATSIEQQQGDQIEYYLHSTQTENLEQLIKSVHLYNEKKNIKNCIRLVRGPVPNNFLCQYIQFIRQHTHDVLVGLTQEGLIIEWNLESHAPCRYAININDILDNIYGSLAAQTLESYIEQARGYYRDRFQFDMQLVSTQDWAAFFQYWKWTGSLRQKDKIENQVKYQSPHRFHFLASIQDLSDYSRTLISAYRKSRTRQRKPVPFRENESLENKKPLPTKQRSLLSQMSRLLSTPKTSKNHQKDRPFSFVLPNNEKPFDDSIYDSNNIQVSPTKHRSLHRSAQKQRHSHA